MGTWKMSKSSVKYVYTFPSLKLDEVVNIKSEDEVREELDVEEDPLALPETTLANRPAFIQAHGEIKEVNIQFACNECDRNFTRKHGLLLHILQVHKLKTTTFSCEKCDFRTTKKILYGIIQIRFMVVSYLPVIHVSIGQQFKAI